MTSRNGVVFLEVEKENESALSRAEKPPTSKARVVPDGHGLVIRLQADGTALFHEVPDRRYVDIHPNCYAPAVLTGVCLLHGGGSGTAVFYGHDPERCEDLVFKHANGKDTHEIFSLVTIGLELLRRGQALASEPAKRMRSRIPEFVMVYLSPYHFRNRGQELWTTVRFSTTARNFMLQSLESNDELTNLNEMAANAPTASGHLVEEDDDMEDEVNSIPGMTFRQIPFMSGRSHGSSSNRRQSSGSLPPQRHGRRQIRYTPSYSRDDGEDHGEVDLEVFLHHVLLSCPGLNGQNLIAEGIPFLQGLENELAREQDDHNWKITLGQKMIGGPNAENGAHVLTSGKLQGPVLLQLVEEFTLVMRDLQSLTYPHEQGTLTEVLEEMQKLEAHGDVTKVSKQLDNFVGSAIRKNYLPATGRFPKLRALGMDLRDGNLILTEEEEAPASFLGRILQPGANLEEIFVDPPTRTCALDEVEHGWLDLLEHATSLPPGPATHRVWTCGLTDAGLHNSFFNQERGLELFDLGQPNLVPLPAFLTKFLMSFFHTMGMEDNEEGTSWVMRFVSMPGPKLMSTQITKERLPYLQRAYQGALDHFDQEIFEGNQNVQRLLTRYVVLQLLSDASFCLEKWQHKGGGTQRLDDCVNRCLEKWMWRSIWDLYIASIVHHNWKLQAA